MPRCYMVKKGVHGERSDAPPPRSPTEATVAPSCYSPQEDTALTESRGGEYAELGSAPFYERSAADTEAAHELLSLAQSVPPLPPSTVLTVLHTPSPAPVVPLYTYTIQPTNIYIITEDTQDPLYAVPTTTVQTIEYPVSSSHINYVSYQTIDAIEQVETQSDTSSNIALKLDEQPSPEPASPQQTKKKASKYVCNECGKRYATSSNLSRHKQTHRSLDSGSAKRCGDCGKVYVSMPALAMHVLTHRMGHVCGVCGKQFSRPWLLRGHVRLHTGEKPYHCTECGKMFADRSNLRAHLQTHSSDKKFECERCDKAFALKSYLNKHQEAACARSDDE